MIILALDTSAAVCSVAIGREDRVFTGISLDQGKTHSTQLMPTVEAALELSELELKDLDYMAVTIGPGSFTGLRIGIAMVQGLATALEKSVVPLSSLAVLAERYRTWDAAVLALMDARHDRVYAALFDGDDCVIEDVLLPIEELAERIRGLDALPDHLILTGDGSEVLRQSEAFQALMQERGVRCFYSDVQYPQASDAVILAKRLLEQSPDSAMDPADLKPAYLTVTSAEKQLGIEV